MSEKKRTRKILVAAMVVLVVVFAFPVINLIGGLPEGGKLAAKQADDPLFAEAVGMMERKCGHCHIPGTDLPFYASLPVASSVIGKDVETARKYFDMAEAFAGEGGIASQAALAKLEFVAERNLMPPTRYVAMHWNASPGAKGNGAIVAWVKDARVKHHAVAGLSKEALEKALRPVPETHSEKAEKVALGDILFHDTRLSKDNTVSCASCHGLDKGGTDQEAVATGVGGAKGPINSPTVYNAGFIVKQFWDGRAEDLKAQAAGPVTNPIEMAAEWDAVVASLNQDAELKAAFEKEYPTGFSMDTITDAIAVFEKTLITPNSPFDKFLKGDEAALNGPQKVGHALFTEMGCATCHCGVTLGGQSFELMGREGDYFTDRGNLHEVDNGRFNVTQKESDLHKFKVPTLRNIAQTFPYFHDASAKTLDEAVQTMARYQNGKKTSEADTKALVAFLEALTGEYQGKVLQ